MLARGSGDILMKASIVDRMTIASANFGYCRVDATLWDVQEFEACLRIQRIEEPVVEIGRFRKGCWPNDAPEITRPVCRPVVAMTPAAMRVSLIH